MLPDRSGRGHRRRRDHDPEKELACEDDAQLVTTGGAKPRPGDAGRRAPRRRCSPSSPPTTETRGTELLAGRRSSPDTAAPSLAIAVPLAASRFQEDNHEAESASVQTLKELKEASSITATSSSSPQGEAVAHFSPPSGCCLSLSPGPRLWERLLFDWGRSFYIRVDLQGCFHTYPDVGGPFQSLQEADKVIDCYLDGIRDPKMRVKEDDGVFSMERVVRQCLYWPDGTLNKRSKSCLLEKAHNRMRQLVQALVDKYNEDHIFLEDLAHELKDVLDYQSFCEKRSWYYHLNFTTKTKGADPNKCSIGNLFFAEVKSMPQGKHKELLVTRCCMVNSNDNVNEGQRCYGCTNHGAVGMKHPDSSLGYTAGHLDVHMPFGYYIDWSDTEVDDDEYVKTREAEIRDMYEGLDKPGALEELFTLPPGVTIVDDD